MTAPTVRTPRAASPPKRARVSLFGHYSVIAQQDAEAGQQQERQLQAYITCKNSAQHSESTVFFPKSTACAHTVPPTSSARPVERMFSQSSLLMRPHRSCV